ncbi:MAG: hypothetical protein EXS41_06640 [Opitutaceae bacterium]|nr:hypothetical protein [Opitutaceae bacterium]
METFPLNGARWHTLPLDLAVLVTENRRDRFTAELFHFGNDGRRIEVSLLTLEPGDYTWRIESTEGRPLSNGTLSVTLAARRVRFALPSRIASLLVVERSP